MERVSARQERHGVRRLGQALVAHGARIVGRLTAHTQVRRCRRTLARVPRRAWVLRRYAQPARLAVSVRGRVPHAAQPARLTVEDLSVRVVLPQVAHVAVVRVRLARVRTLGVDARGGGRLGAAAKGADHLADAAAVEERRAHGYVVVAREQGGGGRRWCEGFVGLARGQVAQAARHEGRAGSSGCTEYAQWT